MTNHDRSWKVAGSGGRSLVLLCLAALPVNSQAEPPVAREHERPGVGRPAERSVLYWYDPMHPQFRSNAPGTSPDCGMDMVPRYADELDEQLPAGAVQISPWKQQLSGVRVAPVARRTLDRQIRTVGIVRADEGRVRTIHTKVEGWVEKLYVDFTGQLVRKGQPVLSVYSPALVSTQFEYLLALRGREQLHHSPFPEAAESSRVLLEAARQRLLFWDIEPHQIRALEESGKPQRALTIHSPFSGYVTIKDVFEGRYVMPGMELYTVTDLDRVWVLIDVYEYEMAAVSVGTKVRLGFASYPGEVVTGEVAYVYPFVEPKTRTNKLRVELDNAGLRFKPEMYATAEIEVSLPDRLSVPADAILDSGTREVVFVAGEGGRFTPRTVRVGTRGGGYAEILDGLSDGEQVVVAANFMVDSESRLKAALDAIGAEAADGHQH
jgi:Cu(I)/Ag(I) efflux system membrane fusion protein